MKHVNAAVRMRDKREKGLQKVISIQTEDDPGRHSLPYEMGYQTQARDEKKGRKCDSIEYAKNNDDGQKDPHSTKPHINEQSSIS